MLWFKSLSRWPRLRSLVSVVLVMTAVGAGGQALAQSPNRLSLNHLVLSWIQGNYATPLVCKIDGASQRGLRRILIDAPDTKEQTPRSRVHFRDLDAGNATRCFTEIGGDAPNITGSLVVRHAVTKLRDTAGRDFKLELKRKRGFELDIVSGSLVISEIGAEGAAPATVDFRGGTLRVHILRQGSDGLRLLQDLPSPRKVRMEFTSRDGAAYSFPASLSKPEERRRPGEADPRRSADRR